MNTIDLLTMFIILFMISFPISIHADVRVVAELLVHDPEADDYFSTKTFIKQLSLPFHGTLRVTLKKTELPSIFSKLKITAADVETDDAGSEGGKKMYLAPPVQIQPDFFFNQLAHPLSSHFGIPLSLEIIKRTFTSDNEVDLSTFNYRCDLVLVMVKIDDFASSDIPLWIWDHSPAMGNKTDHYELVILTKKTHVDLDTQDSQKQGKEDGPSKQVKCKFYQKLFHHGHHKETSAQRDDIKPGPGFLDLFGALPLPDRIAFVQLVVREKARHISAQPFPDHLAEDHMMSLLCASKQPGALMNEERLDAVIPNITKVATITSVPNAPKTDKILLHLFLEHLFLSASAEANNSILIPLGMSLSTIILAVTL